MMVDTIEPADDVLVRPLYSDRQITLLVEPRRAELPLEDWSRAHASWLERTLDRRAACLFRGFGLDSVGRFERFVRAVSREVCQFKEESSPRSKITDAVYTSTDYPAGFPVNFHSEFSYSHEWPMRLFFGCIEPAATGGETPIADIRRIFDRLRPETRRRFISDGLLYVRNYNTSGMGVRWEVAFQTDDRREVEAHCERSGVEYEWGTSGALRTRQRAHAVLLHPRTGEPVWFNHAFVFNIHSLEPETVRRAMLASCKEDELSTNSYFGDGTPIPIDFIEEIRSAYRAEAVGFPWQRGDVLLVDNMLTAHGRAPYRGSRRIVVAMAERVQRTDVAVLRP